MASYEYYVNQGKANLNKGYDYTLQQIIAELGGLTNSTVDNFVAGVEREVTDPRLRSIAEYIQELGAEGYQYKYEDILGSLNAATNAGYNAQLNTLADAASEYNRNMATQQDSVADAIRNQYAQAIQTGVSKGMQSANLLSSILGSSQAAAQGAQKLAQDRYQAGVDLRAQLIQDATDALNKSNSAYETLMGNIRQLYNDEIQEKTADLEYNASVLETNANYLANKYTADTNYASGVLGNASGIYNNNQSVLGALLNAAAGAAAQDNYADTYLKAALEAAAATKYAADQNLAATKYSTDNYKAPVYNYTYGSSGGSSGGSTTQTPEPQSTTKATIKDSLPNVNNNSFVNYVSTKTPVSNPLTNNKNTSTTKNNTSNGNRSTTHTSSSGKTHGGGGKSFGSTTKVPASKNKYYNAKTAQLLGIR